MKRQLAQLWISAISASLLLASCGGGGVAKLKGHVFDIPVYEPSELTDMMGSKSGGDNFTVDGMAWFLKTDSAPEKVITWYESRVPRDSKSVNDEGNTQFNYQPPGAAEHESVGIVIKKGEILIHEDVLPGKRKG